MDTMTELSCIDAEEFDEETLTNSLEQIEIDLLLEAVNRRYGYDFRQYSDKMLRRRLNLFRIQSKADYLSELIPRLLRENTVMHQFLSTMSVTVTEFFRDPAFFLTFKQQVVPLLRTYAFISFWCAGCASGEEAYSWAILLEEEGLLERSRIYATDINDQALSEGRTGVYSEDLYAKACDNYRSMGGGRSLENYCHRSYSAFKMTGRLQKHITFARHNLVHDGVFGEMMVVSCRNVMIYFNASLKRRSLDLFYRSLCHQGVLCLGDSEAIELADPSLLFHVREKRHRIYQKMCASDE